MDFSDNEINFKNNEAIRFVRMLEEFKSLRHLNLLGNPFCKEENQIYRKIVKDLPKTLDFFNNQQKENVAATI